MTWNDKFPSHLASLATVFFVFVLCFSFRFAGLFTIFQPFSLRGGGYKKSQCQQAFLNILILLRNWFPRFSFFFPISITFPDTLIIQHTVLPALARFPSCFFRGLHHLLNGIPYVIALSSSPLLQYVNPMHFEFASLTQNEFYIVIAHLRSFHACGAAFVQFFFSCISRVSCFARTFSSSLMSAFTFWNR